MNSYTDRQPNVKSILQRANPELVSGINKAQAEAVSGSTVYVKIDVDGQKYKAFVDTVSNVNTLLKKIFTV